MGAGDEGRHDPVAAMAAMASGDAPARSFAPIEGRDVRVLILGTMPGTASLGAHQYYAHPRNAFWPIALALVSGAMPERGGWRDIPYAERVATLAGAGVGVWDVLAECRRPGSLDGAIVRSSERANDVAALVARHPGLRTIGFNGRAAQALFARHVRLADTDATRVSFVPLPSTSPAMASLDLGAKHAAWAAALGPLPRPPAPTRGG